MWICKECGSEVVGWERNLLTKEFRVNKNQLKYSGKKGKTLSVTEHEDCCGYNCTNCPSSVEDFIEDIAFWKNKTK